MPNFIKRNAALFVLYWRRAANKFAGHAWSVILLVSCCHGLSSIMILNHFPPALPRLAIQLMLILICSAMDVFLLLIVIGASLMSSKAAEAGRRRHVEKDVEFIFRDHGFTKWLILCLCPILLPLLTEVAIWMSTCTLAQKIVLGTLEIACLLLASQLSLFCLCLPLQVNSDFLEWGHDPDVDFAFLSTHEHTTIKTDLSCLMPSVLADLTLSYACERLVHEMTGTYVALPCIDIDHESKSMVFVTMECRTSLSEVISRSCSLTQFASFAKRMGMQLDTTLNRTISWNEWYKRNRPFFLRCLMTRSVREFYSRQ